MKGIPKTLNSKFDYMYLKDNFEETVWKPAFNELLTHTQEWFNQGEITGTGVNDDTQKTFTDKEGKTYQFVLQDTQNSKLAAIGWTEDEVKAFITQKEVSANS